MLLWLKSLVWGSAPKTRWELVRHLLGPWYGRKLYQGPTHDFERVQLNQLRCQQVRQERYSTLGLSKGPQQIAQQSMNFDMANSTWSTERGTQPGATLGGTSEVQKLPLWPPGSWENTHVAADPAEPNQLKHGMQKMNVIPRPTHRTSISDCPFQLPEAAQWHLQKDENVGQPANNKFSSLAVIFENYFPFYDQIHLTKEQLGASNASSSGVLCFTSSAARSTLDRISEGIQKC